MHHLHRRGLIVCTRRVEMRNHVGKDVRSWVPHGQVLHTVLQQIHSLGFHGYGVDEPQPKYLSLNLPYKAVMLYVDFKSLLKRFPCSCCWDLCVQVIRVVYHIATFDKEKNKI